MTLDFCAGPFCDLDHTHDAFLSDAPIVGAVADPDLLDWEGPQAPEYSESDDEAWSETFGGHS